MSVAELPLTRRLIPKLLWERAFRRYWTAQTISLLGDQVTLLAIPLLAVLGAGAGPAQMGYLTAAGLVPHLLFSLLAGAWMDKLPYKRLSMIIADVFRALLLLWVPVSYALGTLTLTQLYVVAFLTGTFSVIFEVSRNTLFAALVSKDDYIPAETLLNGARALSYVAGPSIGGVLIQVLSAPVALIADAVSYLYSAFLLKKVEAVEPAPQPSEKLGIGEGLRYIWHSLLLRNMLAGTTTLNLFNYMFSALVLLYISIDLHLSPGIIGLVIGAASVGALIGASVTGRLVAKFGSGPMLIVGYVLFPAPLVLVPLATGSQPTVVIIALLFAAEFLSGFGVMVLDILAGSFQIAAVPDALRARVAGAYRTVNYGIRPIGALIGGALGSSLGTRETLWISAIGAVAGALWLLPAGVWRMRELPDVVDQV
ncbi:MFS transporter [Catelliglobosispora koreensis]|uniref:MFS transporter n=1 Tax=Catelliglobosispora koreensis TaxID=129052 RepID=UPI000372E483|nr:MFS transporter [Catelliglobosispora koreensis]